MKFMFSRQQYDDDIEYESDEDNDVEYDSDEDHDEGYDSEKRKSEEQTFVIDANIGYRETKNNVSTEGKYD